MTPRFTHDEQGTTDAEWFADPVWDQVPALAATELPRPRRGGRVVVLAAHPDDETIGLGATIAALAADGEAISLVLATAGEQSHPGSTVWSPEQVAAVRLDEWRRATHELAPRAEHHPLGLPDGGLAGAEPALREAVAARVSGDDLVLAPWTGDGHPDHEAVGRAAAHVARATGARVLYYPVWWWHWNRPGQANDLLRQQALLVEPGATAVHRKHAALACYPSQHTGLGPGEEHGPVVTASIQARARRCFEVLFGDWRPGATAVLAPDGSVFDEMYDAGDDPWGWEDSWYERRRRHLVMAALGRERYQQVLELGCGTGLLTTELAPRSERVTAVDVSRRALQVADRRGLPNVTWVQGPAAELPEGGFDLVVVSELAYFLRPGELLALVRRARRQLSPEGEVLFADWRHPTKDIPLDGPLVHELVAGVVGLPRRSHYRDDDVVVETWSAAPSVASREGLV